MNLRDMLNSIEEAPSSQSMRVAKATGQNAQVAQRSHDNISKRTDVASKNVSKQLDLFDFMASDKFSMASTFASMVEKARKEMLQSSPNMQPDPSLLQQSKDVNFNEFVDQTAVDNAVDNAVDTGTAFKGAYAQPETVTGEIPINVLSNVMGDDTLVNLMRQALRQIQNERGINKRFMPALKIFLAPYVSILKSGFTGYNQIMALQKALSRGTDDAVGNADATSSNGQEVSPENIPDPSTEEIKQYGVDNNLPTVSGEEQQEVSKLIKQDKADAINKDGNMNKKESVELQGKDELKRLSEIVEAMSDAYGQPEIVAPVQIKTDDQETSGTVTFRQDKSTDKGSVSIEASGEDMQELAKVLKLAGLTLPQDMYKDEPDSDKEDNDHEGHDDIEKDHVEDGETCDCCGNEVVDGECGCGPECPHCGGKPGDLPKDDKVMVLSPKDASYSTDKEVLVNYLKDKLKKSIS
jgi:hypothetical protein